MYDGLSVVGRKVGGESEMIYVERGGALGVFVSTEPDSVSTHT